MRNRVVLLSILVTCLLLPTTFSFPTGMDASAVNDGCGCHGEANSSVGISTEDSELVDEWIPGKTYVMTFLATEAAGSPDEPSAMVHVLVDVGVFNLDGLATGHIIESSQHLRTEEQHNAPRHIRFNWVAR